MEGVSRMKQRKKTKRVLRLSKIKKSSDRYLPQRFRLKRKVYNSGRDELHELSSLMAHVSIKRDYSVYRKTLREMRQLARLDGARNEYDCVIYSMYCVGLIQKPLADELAQRIVAENRTFIEEESIVNFLETTLYGTVKSHTYATHPFYWFEQHKILHNGEVMLLAYRRSDHTGHMVVLGKMSGNLYIYDKQIEHVYTIGEFLAAEPTISRFYLFKITLHQPMEPPNLLGIPWHELQ
jgi:hypothetical protein